MKFILNKDTVELIDDKEKMNSGSVEYYEAEVEWDETWNGLTKEAVIVKSENNKLSNVGKYVGVPTNKIHIDQNIRGTYYIGFKGFLIENNKKTYQISTNFVPKYFGPGAGEIETQEQEIPTLTEWEIYIAQIQEMIKGVQSIPSGGTVGQVLSKKSDSDYDYEWRDQEGGGLGTEEDPTVPEYVKNITEENIEEWNNKASISDMTDYIEEHKDELKGDTGKSAYQIWLDEGNEGTEQDFLDSLEGVDGFSPTASIIETDTGTLFEITDKNGTSSVEIKNGENGKNGADGEDGKDGYTPVKNVDYFTEEDKEEIKSDVVGEITPTLNQNLSSAKSYTDNAISRDFKDISYNEETATFIFTRHDNTIFTVDLPIEQTVKNGYYDENSKELVLVLVSDQEIRIPATGLIDDYDGLDSATIQCVVSADNKITCNIIAGSISKTLLTTELQQELDSKVNEETFVAELIKKLNTADVTEEQYEITYKDGSTRTVRSVVFK